jgi:hypothetical protein
VNHPDFGDAKLNYSVQDMPASGDAQVAATIRQMCKYVIADCNTPELMEDAAAAKREGNGDPIVGAYRLARRRIRFQHDASTGRFGGKDVVEVLIRPIDVSLMARNNVPVVGDCDDFSMYVAALLLANLVPCCFVTVAADASDPNAYSHVYVAAYGDKGRVAVDASHGKFCGWEAPNQFGKCREWEVRADGSAGGGDGFAGLVKLALLGVAGYFLYKEFHGKVSGFFDALPELSWEDN